MIKEIFEYLHTITPFLWCFNAALWIAIYYGLLKWAKTHLSLQDKIILDFNCLNTVRYQEINTRLSEFDTRFIALQHRIARLESQLIDTREFAKKEQILMAAIADKIKESKDNG